jgi:hypothetical protein
LAAAPVCTKRLVHIHRRREGTVLRSKSFVFLAILAEITSVTVSIDDELAVRCCKLLHYYGDQKLVGSLVENLESGDLTSLRNLVHETLSGCLLLLMSVGNVVYTSCLLIAHNSSGANLPNS